MERESSLREQRERLRAARKKRDRERSESSSGGSLNVKSGGEIRGNASCDETLPSTRTDASQNDNTDDSTNLVSGSELASNSTNLVEAKDEVGEIAAFTARQREASGGESVVSESTMSALSESGASGTNPWESQWSRDKSDPQFSARNYRIPVVPARAPALPLAFYTFASFRDSISLRCERTPTVTPLPRRQRLPSQSFHALVVLVLPVVSIESAPPALPLRVMAISIWVF